MKIRPLKQSEIKIAGSIVKKNYNVQDQKSVILEMEDMFRKGSIRPKYIVAEDNGQILGFAGYMQSWIDYAIYQIFWVNVIPEMQNKGIGKILVKKIISEIKKDKGAKLIILSASIPEYYTRNFKFKTIDFFNGNTHKHYLLSLKVKKQAKKIRHIVPD